MPLAELLESLECDAREEAERLLGESREKAQRLLERAREEADELAIAPVREAETMAAAKAGRIRARARLSRATALRAIREEAAVSALAAVRERLEDLREQDDYPGWLLSLTQEAHALLPSADALHVDGRDEHLAGPLVEACGGLRVETTLETWGGIVLADDRGRSIRNTFEARLESVEAGARALVAASLEGTED